MITSAHVLIYSDDAHATRQFLKNVLQWPYVEDPESEPDWPIFRTGPSEIGVHPTSTEWRGETYTSPRHHSLSLMCDDLETTIAELTERGAEFEDDPSEMGFGRGTMLKVPGADSILLYRPRHATAYDLYGDDWDVAGGGGVAADSPADEDPL